MNGDEPAFPLAIEDFVDYDSHRQKGMSKREVFAGMAMVGFLAGTTTEVATSELARISCRVADALLAELDKRK